MTFFLFKFVLLNGGDPIFTDANLHGNNLLNENNGHSFSQIRDPIRGKQAGHSVTDLYNWDLIVVKIATKYKPATLTVSHMATIKCSLDTGHCPVDSGPNIFFAMRDCCHSPTQPQHELGVTG